MDSSTLVLWPRRTIRHAGMGNTGRRWSPGQVVNNGCAGGVVGVVGLGLIAFAFARRRRMRG